MSQFLLIIAEGWTQLDWQFVTNQIAGMDQNTVLNAINSNMFSTFEEPFKAAGIIPQDSSVLDAKLIDDAYFMVRLG